MIRLPFGRRWGVMSLDFWRNVAAESRRTECRRPNRHSVRPALLINVYKDIINNYRAKDAKFDDFI